MAKRKKPQPQEVVLTNVIKALPTWLLIMIICLGLLLGVLMETGILPEEKVQGILGFSSSQSVTEQGGQELPAAARDFSVNVIDVGQGDSILILAGGKSILIDAGEKEYGERVCEIISSKGIKKLDYIIATHPHSDHIGGMAKVVETFGADKIIIPRLPDEMVPTTKVYENFLTAVKNKGCKLTAAKAGTVYDIASVNGRDISMTVLTPVPDASYSDLNDYSVSVRIDFGRISWLLTGDLSKEGERDLLASGADIDVTAYKVGHHGSSTSSSKKLLERVTPMLCVISCGQGNSYGHPNDDTLKRLEGYTSSIYRTDISSDISVYSDGERLYAVSSKGSGK